MRTDSKDVGTILKRLQKRTVLAQKELKRQFPHVVAKLEDLEFDLSDIRAHSASILGALVLAGGIVLVSPSVKSAFHQEHEQTNLSPDELIKKLKEQLKLLLPARVGPLPAQTEDELHDILKTTFNINAVASLDGNHLNTTYGYIGAEQHLPRYPGDTISQHDELQAKGQTPGKGAWGYFAPSKAAMTPEKYAMEKYYVAVQTLYLPNWKSDLKYLRDWYKYRKVLVVNPANGKSVIAVVADAGPAAWTGKHFGGSPKVIEQLGVQTGKQKGAVILFFVDDTDNVLALGPVKPTGTTFIAER